jgi:DNA-directed RNA polymerase subunit RPC12/RpoP
MVRLAAPPVPVALPIAIPVTGSGSFGSVSSVVPWWMGEPDDRHVCADCRQAFADEATFYCHTCGRDLCPECADVLQETREIQCSRCAAENR